MKELKEIRIGNKMIGEKYPAYIIAEIGLNHQGDMSLAKKLIDVAIEVGADAVKFQKRSMKRLFKKDVLENLKDQEHGLQYAAGHVMKCELTAEQMTELHRYSVSGGVDFLCSPWEEESLRFLQNLNLPAYKIGSPDMFNLPLIRAVALLKKPIIISTGMSFSSEVDQVIEFLNAQNARYVLMHCNSAYPPAFHDINLKFLEVLKDKSRYPVGYSGHEHGIAVSVAAVTLGARIIERHLTLDKSLPGPDHRASLGPEEFRELVKQIRNVELSMGEPVRYPTRGEFLNRENLSKSLVVTHDIARGTVLKYEDISVRSPGKGTTPLKLGYFIGRTIITRDLKEGDYLLESDVDYYERSSLRGLAINSRWGIVVRMGDIDELIANCQPKFVELHATDTDIKLERLNNKQYDIDLTIHGPEYDGELLLDISSLDSDVRARSVAFYNKVLDYARKVKKYFRNANKKVIFVMHPGGSGIDKPLLGQIPQLNKNLLNSLKQLNTDGFELLVENMPALPWYFGGQHFQSSFMNPDEIVNFSKETGYGIVLDISHAALYCNYYRQNLEEFIKKVLPVARHIHIADAAGFNGEGLKIGRGAIDFKMVLAHLLTRKDLKILMEIWQGHKFGGEDFVNAVKLLQTINPDF